MKGVLLVNLGSPDSPTPKAVKPYLDEFLMDERVIDVPKWLTKCYSKGHHTENKAKEVCRSLFKDLVGRRFSPGRYFRAFSGKSKVQAQNYPYCIGDALREHYHKKCLKSIAP